MTRRPLLLLLVLTFLACSSTTPPAARVAPATSAAPTPAPTPFLATATAQRVVLLSFDGLGADALARQKGLAAFDQLARDGATARIIPVNPTVTSSTHISILTGADPQRHGVVSNRFHLPGTPPEATQRGHDADIDVETLVEAARRQGKRVGAVSFPGVDTRASRRSADFGLVWSSSLTQGRVVKLTRADFRREWVPPTWTARPQRRTSYSPIMRARLEWAAAPSLRTDVDVVAYDTTNDARENYDTYTVELNEEDVPLDARGWFAIARPTTTGVHGSWSKVMQTSPTLDVSLYWGPISRTNAYPESFRAMLDEEAGFWPGEPDELADIDAATFAEQIERLADFYTRAQLATIRRMPFDLLLAYQPQIDEASHNFLGYDDTVIARAFHAADGAVAAIRAELDPARDALVVTGDHGLVPVQRQIHVNRLLAERGFAPRWQAYVSGSLGHFYRFEGADDADALVNTLTSTGFFERVERRSATSHRNSGDVIAWAYPDTDLSASSDPPVIATEPESYGHHGALNTHRELHPVLFAVGPGVPRGVFGELAQTRIARFVSQLLGITPPNAAE